MRKPQILSIILLLGGWTLPASACLNDTSTEDSEQTFRSQYGVKPTVETPEPTNQTYSLVALSIGAALIGGCAVVGINKLGKKSA